MQIQLERAAFAFGNQLGKITYWSIEEYETEVINDAVSLIKGLLYKRDPLSVLVQPPCA